MFSATLILSTSLLSATPSLASYREIYPGQKEKETLTRFLIKKNECSKVAADPCENEKLNAFDPKDLLKEVRYFKDASKDPLLTEAEQKALSSSYQPSSYKVVPTADPPPEVIESTMKKILACKHLKGTGMSLSMAQEEPESNNNIFSDFSNRRIYFGKNAFKGFQKDISPDQLYSAVAFVLAHELGHFITEAYARSKLNNGLTASGNLNGIEIQRQFSKLSSDDERQTELAKRGHLFHDEVDAAAIMLMTECGLPIPSISTIMLSLEEDPNDFNYCTFGRKRALMIHKNLELIRKRDK